MKLIYASGFSRAEREDCRSTIFANLVTAFRTIFKAMDEIDIPFEDPSNEVRDVWCSYRGLADLTYPSSNMWR